MVWEIVFMLLILKIPIVYLSVVIWWAIRAEPLPPDLEQVSVVLDTPSGDSPRHQRSQRRRPVRPHTPGRGRATSRLRQRAGVRG